MHISVLKKEVLEMLDPKAGENFIDATLGFGGHALAILDKVSPNGRVLGIEWDKEVFEKTKPCEGLLAVNDTYANIKEIVEKHNFKPVNGILFDLGISSWDLEGSGRGFSFMRDEPLDMRFDPNSNMLTAEIIVNTWPERDIAQVIWEFGEERFSRVIAKRIAEKRKAAPIKTTFELKVLIPKRAKPFRTFQGLRIAVNDELGNLKRGLEQATDVLEKDGRLAVISFHSLEDRIVKNFFKNNENFRVLNKKVIKPSKEEVKENYRSRSAKLRAAVKK
ncbi:MAG: 16S rRNA (cytosine(1402)-N(4))-methyltransferase RsmH [bacterium]|nr:16S rRNA (cytosine(1402)-N(4))-methyltransferase RsmH [bacterium]